jgi:hypothetical protein
MKSFRFGSKFGSTAGKDDMLKGHRASQKDQNSGKATSANWYKFPFRIDILWRHDAVKVAKNSSCILVNQVELEKGCLKHKMSPAVATLNFFKNWLRTISIGGIRKPTWVWYKYR